MTAMTAPPSIDLIEMVGHKQLHADVWRCRMCLLERGGFYTTLDELKVHLTGGPMEGGHSYSDLIVEDGCVYVKV